MYIWTDNHIDHTTFALIKKNDSIDYDKKEYVV